MPILITHITDNHTIACHHKTTIPKSLIDLVEKICPPQHVAHVWDISDNTISSLRIKLSVFQPLDITVYPIALYKWETQHIDWIPNADPSPWEEPWPPVFFIRIPACDINIIHTERNRLNFSVYWPQLWDLQSLTNTEPGELPVFHVHLDQADDCKTLAQIFNQRMVINYAIDQTLNKCDCEPLEPGSV